jgi:peptidyl-prolyl cis-trans isomerase SurA
MKRLVFGLILIVLFMAPLPSRGEVTDRIVAIVNDDIITLREVEGFVTVEKVSRYTSMNEYVRSVALGEKLDSFIESLLIRQEARKFKIEVDDKEVQGSIENIRKQNLISESELKEQLQRQNVRYASFVESVKNGMIRNKVLARAVSQEVNIDDKAIQEYYDTHLDDYTDEEYSFQHIFISGQRQDALTRAGAAFEELEKGGSFTDVAKEFSDEPSKGETVTTKKEELIPELRQALQPLKTGSYTPVVQTPYGYHILRLMDVKKGARIPLDDVRDKVKEAIFQRESAKRYKEYVAKLKAAAYIEVKI